MERRDFLKLGGAALASAGIMAVTGKTMLATSDFSRESTMTSTKPVYRPDGWKGAKVRYLDYPGGSFDINAPRQADLNQCSALGTSKITGTIERIREAQSGFSIFDTGGYGDVAMLRAAAGPQYFSPMGNALTYSVKHYGKEEIVDGEPRQRMPIPGPEDMTRHIKDLAFYLGADDCGVGVLPLQALYTHQMATSEDVANGMAMTDEKPVGNTHPYCITILYDQDFRTGTMASDGYDGGTFGARRAYFLGSTMSCIMARYIRNLGYSARSHNNENYQLCVPPALIASGMGELCRVGDCVLHPYLGFNYKAAVITTDMPLMPDRPIDFGVQSFCRTCKKCAENCPSKSISFDDEQTEYNGYLKYKLDYKSCTIFRRTQPEGYGCGRCAVVCPWSSKEESWFHSLASWLSSMKSDAVNRVIKQMDDICGYGTEFAHEYKWWIGFPGEG
ncbi:MAG: reductive dehalogenase [Gracilibacteraceae bacterium]|jgi:reductive dehalogenase|nr:reductive dehalogenase [Gracilibacteraceae bacterium]